VDRRALAEATAGLSGEDRDRLRVLLSRIREATV
jgi:hypothetical protein